MEWLVKQYAKSETLDLKVEVINPGKVIKPKNLNVISLV